MSPRPLNVLLLLSSEQKPEPIEQIDVLEQESNKNPDGVTHFVTTRRCAESLTPGESTVAFFGDHAEKYKLLGKAIFLGWFEKESEEWNEVLHNHPLYRRGNIPDTATLLLKLKDVCRISDGEIEDLNGVLDDGSSLTFLEVRRIGEYRKDVFGTRFSSFYYLSSRGVRQARKK